MSWEWGRFQELFLSPSRNGIYKSKEYRGEGYKLVNMGELFANDFLGEQPMDRIQLNSSELEKNKLDKGDLLFGRRSLIESGAGKCSIVKNLPEDTVFESSIIRVRLDKKTVDPRFYFYWFKSRKGRGSIAALITGTNVKGIRGSDLKKISVPIPPKDEQAKVSDFLEVYDSQVENNRRRIQLLEESARLLYREWFVHLRFPGHEHVKVLDGVPEGWKRSSVSEVCDILSGGTPKTSVEEYWGGDIPFFTPKDATDSIYARETEKTLTESGLKNCSSQLYPKNTIFITARGTVGRLNLAQVPMAMNQSCYALVAKEPLNQFVLYFGLQAGIEYLKNQAVGAVFDAIIRDTFKRIPFLLPSEGLITDFTEAVTPIFQQIDNLSEQNRKLAEARDLLLPRLMNGEIAV